MVEWPASVPFWILLVGYLVLLVQARFMDRFYSRVQWWAVLILLFTTMLQNQVLALRSTDSITSGILLFDKFNFQMGALYLLACLLVHVCFVFENKAFERELAPLQIASVLSGYVLIFSNSFLIYAFLIPLLIEMVSYSQLLLSSSRLRKPSFSKFRISMVSFVLFFLSFVSLETVFGTAYLTEINHVATANPDMAMVWGISALMLLSSVFIVPTFLVEVYDDSAGSWSLLGFFKNGFVFAASIVLWKWSVLGPHFGANTQLYFSLILFGLALWILVNGFWGMTWMKLLDLTMMISVSLALLGTSVDLSESRAWSIVGLSLSGLFVPGLIAHFLNRSAEPFSRVKGSQNVANILLLLIFLVAGPLSNSFINVIQLIMAHTPQALWDIGKDDALKVVVLCGALLCLALHVILSFSIFNRQSLATSKFSISWGAGVWCWVIAGPLLFLGFYSRPLYNYIVFLIR